MSAAIGAFVLGVALLVGFGLGIVGVERARKLVQKPKWAK